MTCMDLLGYNFMYGNLRDLMICFMMFMSIAADSFLSGSDTDPSGWQAVTRRAQMFAWIFLTFQCIRSSTTTTTTTHNPQPTTHNPQPTTHNPQPTTHNQQPTTNNQQPTSNNQQPTTTSPTSNILRPLPPTLGTAATTTNAHTQNIHSAKLTSLAGKWTRIEDVYSTKIGGYSIQLSSAMFVYQRVIRNIKAIYTNRSRPHPQFLWMTCWTVEINKKTYIVRGGYWKGWHRFMWNPMNIHTYIYMCIYINIYWMCQ